MFRFVGGAGGVSVPIVVGVDTHRDQHVAVAINQQGVRLGERYAPATICGYGNSKDGPRVWGTSTPSVLKVPVLTALASLAS